MALFIQLSSRKIISANQQKGPDGGSNEADSLAKDMEVLQQNIDHEAEQTARIAEADKNSGLSDEFMATTKGIVDKKAKVAAEHKESKQEDVTFAKSMLSAADKARAEKKDREANQRSRTQAMENIANNQHKTRKQTAAKGSGGRKF